MTIVYDEKQVTPEQIIAKVEKAGFGAALHQDQPEGRPGPGAQGRGGARSCGGKKRELIVAAVFSRAAAVCVHGADAALRTARLPLPDLFSMHTHPVNFAILQLLLAIPVLYCGRTFLHRRLQGTVSRQSQHGLSGGHRLRLLLCLQRGDDLPASPTTPTAMCTTSTMSPPPWC